MRRKGIFTILMAAFMVLAFSAMALAANNVRLTTTVPNIPKSTCYQAGTDTMEFDTGTAINEGDVIQVTLNNKVTLCKALDMFITFNAGGAATTLETSADAPIATTGGTITAATGTGQWGFLVQGVKGSQIITVTLRKRDTVAFTLVPLPAVPAVSVMMFTGNVAADKLFLKLFDGKFGFGASLIYTQLLGVYNTGLTAITGPITNILCIDTLTQDFPDEYVQNTPDSLPLFPINKLFFSGDYRIAHIMTAVDYSIVTCKGVACGNILLGSSTQTTSCVSFDYETIGTGANGYCSTHTALTGTVPKVILQSSQPYEVTSYGITADILVNGSLAAKGVYWSSTAPTYNASATSQCGALGTPATFALPGAITYAYADGTSVGIAPRASGAYDCTIAATAKATRWTMATAAGLFAAGQYYLNIDLPPFVYNLAEINPGDVVSIRLTLTKGTCGTVSKDLCIGTFIAACPTTPAAGAVSLCPYVTSLAAGDTYWDGIAVVNTGAAAGTVDLKAFKNDGTTSTFTTPSIAAGGMYVKLVSAIPWVGTMPVGVPAYITLQASSTIPAGSLEAFVMMADGANNSMGYLCKP
jgi:hypothetical protein